MVKSKRETQAMACTDFLVYGVTHMSITSLTSNKYQFCRVRADDAAAAEANECSQQDVHMHRNSNSVRPIFMPLYILLEAPADRRAVEAATAEDVEFKSSTVVTLFDAPRWQQARVAGPEGSFEGSIAAQSQKQNHPTGLCQADPTELRLAFRLAVKPMENAK
eukprot:2001872-Amphidinium_carterae.1